MEQLLISDTMDRAVSQMDLRALAGKTVFLDDTPIRGMTDAAYLASSVRQHVLASGGILRESKNEADYVLEIRAGAIGTDRHDVTYGLPAVNFPSLFPINTLGIPAHLPEMPIAKRTYQRAVTKIALFAYNRRTGRPIWQSGSIPVESDVRALWVFGAGPFLRGQILRGTNFAGDEIKIPLVDFFNSEVASYPRLSITQEAFFAEASPPSDEPKTTSAETPPFSPPEPQVAQTPEAAANQAIAAPASPQASASSGASPTVTENPSPSAGQIQQTVAKGDDPQTQANLAEAPRGENSERTSAGFADGSPADGAPPPPAPAEAAGMSPPEPPADESRLNHPAIWTNKIWDDPFWETGTPLPAPLPESLPLDTLPRLRAGGSGP